MGGQIIFFLVFFILARLLDPKDFGLVAYAAVFSSFFSVFLQLGYKDAIVQIKDLDQQHLSTVFWASAAIGLLLTALCIAAAFPIGWITDQPKLTPIIQALSFSCLLGGFNTVHSAILLRDMRFKEIANRTLVSNTLGGITGVALACTGLGVWALVAQRLVVEVMLLIMTWIAARYHPKCHFSFRHLKQLTRFSNRVFGINLVNYADQYVDQLLIGIYLSQTQLGYYSVGRRLSLTLSITLLDTFRSVSFPMFSRIQDDPEKVKRAVYEGTSIVTYFTYPIFLGLAVLAPEAIAVAFGSRWASVAPLLWAFCLLGFYSTSMIMFIGVCKGTGHPSYILIQRIVSVTLNIVAFTLVVQYGIFWVAVAITIRAYLTSPLQLWFMHKAAGIGYGDFLRTLMAPAAVTSVSIAAGFCTRIFTEPLMPPLPRLILCIAAIVLVHTIAIRIFAPSVFIKFRGLLANRTITTQTQS